MDDCRYCHREVKFVKHFTSGRTMCLELNPPPELKPNIRLSLLPALGGLVAIVCGQEEAEAARARGVTIALDHHATCPRFQKKRS